MSKSSTDELPDLTLPVERRCPFTPPEGYARLRAQAPINKTRLVYGLETWIVSGHEEARAILTDPRFSANRGAEGFPFVDPDPIARKRFTGQAPNMLSMDGEEHAATRRSVLGEFTMKRLNALEPRTQAIVDGFIDDMLATDERPVDLVQALSLPVPSLVICEMLGAPYEDHDFFQSRTGMAIRRSARPEERQQAFVELRAYMDDLVTRKESEPGDDLFSRMIAKQRVDGTLDHESLVSMALLLLGAGHETTANMISLGVVGLLNHPDQLAAIKADPAKTPMAVEELLRYFSIADTVTSRIATEDVRVGDVTIKAGEGVVVSGLSADWDPQAFTNPADLDIERGSRRHIAFGFGPHQCLGQNLARMELRIVFDTLFRRIPTLRLATPVDDVPFKTDANLYGAYELPVTW